MGGTLEHFITMLFFGWSVTIAPICLCFIICCRCLLMSITPGRRCWSLLFVKEEFSNGWNGSLIYSIGPLMYKILLDIIVWHSMRN
jgi:hypothetical protein